MTKRRDAEELRPAERETRDGAVQDPEEQAYLDAVQHFIETRMANLEANNEKRLEDETSMKAEAWDSHLELKDGPGAADSAVIQHELALNATVLREQNSELKRLGKLWNRPYFGRMDVAYGPKDRETYYVGLMELLDADALKQYVIDWRSPVAAIYYEDEPGDVAYETPRGTVHAELLGKKQIVIEHGEIRYVFDTAEQISDDILQLVLSRRAGAHMREIVSTLQKEQNAIIRAEPNLSALVQGVAGSGKTSIALHRASYLLYRDADLNASAILIISPNPEFSEYISRVLPDLGDDEAPTLTMRQLMVDEVADEDGSLRRLPFPEAERVKKEEAASFDLVEALEQFSASLESHLFLERAIKMPTFTVRAEMLGRLYYDNYRAWPPFARFRAIIEHLADEFRDKKFGRYREFVEAELADMFATWSLEDLLARFKAWRDPDGEVLRSADGIKDDVDLALMAWLKVRFFGTRDLSPIHHLIVDEMQDLYPVEHDLLRRMFDCPRTVLGDVNQAVRFNLPPRYLTGLRTLYGQDGNLNFFTLNHAYRSTYEITMFARALIGRPEIEPIERHGADVAIAHFDDAEAMARAHRETLDRWREAGYGRIAVIAEDEAARRAVYESLKDREDVGLRPGGSKARPVTVLDPESAKGMEFDAVLIWDASDRAYGRPLDQTRLYVAVTRALHELALGILGDPSPWLPE